MNGLSIAGAKHASREDLCKWYEATIGYRPDKDSPSITTNEVRSIAVEYLRDALSSS